MKHTECVDKTPLQALCSTALIVLSRRLRPRMPIGRARHRKHRSGYSTGMMNTICARSIF